jgi:hypothetical protein
MHYNDISVEPDSIIEPEDSLSVEFSSFTANVRDNNVNLIWSTVYELNNNAGFEIQRRIQTDSFIIPWNIIGFVEGMGTPDQGFEYQFTDNDIHLGAYEYRLKQIDLDGASVYVDTLEVTIEKPDANIMFPNYPNPFNSETTIKYFISEDNAQVKLKIFDINGREITTLINRKKRADYYTVKWDGTNMQGQTVAGGVYFYHLVAGGYVKTGKMILLK